jgi:hypothetical protein
VPAVVPVYETVDYHEPAYLDMISLLTVARLTFNIVDISLSVLPCADNSAQRSLLQEMC